MSIVLLNVGNGLDIACGYQTSYLDFVHWLSQDSNQKEKMKLFWNDASSKALEGNYYQRFTGFANEILRDKRWFLYEWVRHVESTDWMRSISNTNTALPKVGDKNWSDLEQLMLNLINTDRLAIEQIKFVEDKFQIFLKTILNDQSPLKIKKTSSLLQRLGFDYTFIWNYILNFNFTNITLRLRLDNDRFQATENNVHGSIYGYFDQITKIEKGVSTIFGVNKNEISNPKNNKFSKTYRKLSVGGPLKGLPEKVDVIAFFGHSLNNQDSNYFFTEFDKYDIYNSNVRIVFYYDDMYPIIENAFNLLRRYEVNVNNHNIIQRLQLENRLLMKSISADI